jgi:uncharacterized protein
MNALLDSWKSGNGFPDTLVIDGHIHIGKWRHAATFACVDEAVAESQAYCNAHGVDAFCAMGGGTFHPGYDYREGNDFLLEVWNRLKDRLIPFFNINPNDSKKNIMDELGRMHKAGMRCIKLHNSHQENYPGDGPRLMELFEFADAHRMLVFNHAWNPDVILKISKEFPRTDFVYGHYGSWQGNQDEVLRKRENVYTNVWCLDRLGWLEQGIKKVGAHKFMFGSDGFLNPLSVGIGPVVFASISDEDKRHILGINVARLLDKVNALPDSVRKKYKFKN